MERFHTSNTPIEPNRRANGKGDGPDETHPAMTSARDLAFATVGLQLAWTTAPDGSVVDDIPLWRTYTGQTPDEVQGLGWLDALHPQEHAEATRRWLQSIASRTPFEAEFRLKRSDESYNYFLAQALPLFAENSVIHAWTGICTNTTQYRQQEEMQRESEWNFRATSVEDISELKKVEEELAYRQVQEEAARKQTEEVNAQLLALQAITDSALANLSPGDLQRAILSRIREIMAVDNITVLLLTEDEQYLKVSAVQGLEEIIAPDVHIPVGKGFAGHIVTECRPSIVHDISQIEIFNPLLRGEIRSLMGVPLIIQDRVIGVLHIGTRQTRHFTPDDLQLLQRVASRIAQTLERVSLYKAQHSAQEEAARHTRLLETAFETITDGIIVFNAQGDILQKNAAASHMMSLDLLPVNINRLTAEERFRAFIARDEAGRPLQLAQSPLIRILNGEMLTGTNVINMSILTPDQREVFINVSGAPMHNADRDITGAVCIYRDITKSRQLERRTEMLGALVAMAETLVQFPTPNDQGNQPQLRSLLIHIVGQRIVELTQKMLRCQGVGIMTIEPESETIYPVAAIGLSPSQEQFFFQAMANTRLADILHDPTTNERLHSGEILVLDLEKLIPPEHLQLSNWRTVLTAPIRIGHQFIGLLYTVFENHQHMYTDEEIELIGAMAKLSALAIERERRETEHEMLLVVLQEANTQLEQINKLQNDFISIISHEFRTTLTGIQGFSELLRDEDFSPEEVKEFASDIHTDARRLTRLIGELLDLERMKLGKIQPHLEPININTILHEAGERIRLIAARHPMRFHLTEDLPLLQGDHDKLSQAVINLLTNAVKYSPAGGEILLTTLLEDTVVHIKVEDHGIGIPEDAYERIFMQYNRIEGDATRYITGPGLGLPLVRQIVHMHGGHVWVESRLGLGSTFHIVLPLTHMSIMH